MTIFSLNAMFTVSSSLSPTRCPALTSCHPTFLTQTYSRHLISNRRSRHRPSAGTASILYGTASAPCSLAVQNSVTSEIQIRSNQVFNPDLLASAAGVQRLVHCGTTPLGRGLVALQPLEPEAIVSVPLQNALILTDEPLNGISVFGDRCQLQWQQDHGSLPQLLQDFLTGDARWDVRMTAWLLWVASVLPNSPVWGPYLSSLPPVEELTCLLNYQPDEARELQFKELMEEARLQYNWALNVHKNYFDNSRGELGQLGLAVRSEDTIWAMSLVRTRTFSEDVNGEALTLMVPYADMANHSFTFNSTFCMSKDNKRFELRLLSSLAAGEQASICYGEEKTNSEMMRDYGFVVAGNPNDRIRMPNQDMLPALNGASLIQSLGFTGDWRQEKGGGGGRVGPSPSTLQALGGDPEVALSLARRRSAVLSMNLSDGFPAMSGGRLFEGIWPSAKAWTESGRPPPQPLRSGPSAGAAEREVVAIVRQSYQAALDELPTSINDDEALLCGAGSAVEEGGNMGGGPEEQKARHAGAVAAVAGAECGPLTAKQAAAVRCRLEHKLLLREAVRALDLYERWLVERQRL